MFRPINSDDHTHFRPPAEQVRQADGAYQGHKRDFSYEIEQVSDKKKDRQHEADHPFGEDTFEAGADEQPDTPDANSNPEKSDRKPPDSGHVDLQA